MAPRSGRTQAKIIVYQPQPESLDGNQLTGRAAMSILVDGSEEQMFGTFWFTARLETDRNSDIAVVGDIKVLKVRWPDSKDAGEQRFTAQVEAALPTTGFEISMERLASSLATAELEFESLENLNNDPPKIVFRRNLAVLLSYDGQPRYSAIENSDYERVLNTPIVVVKDKRGTHYVTNGKLWYVASSAMGPWQHTTSPPKDLAEAMPEADPDAPDWDTPPEIVVATEPTELIVTDGPPQWKSLAGGEVLYAAILNLRGCGICQQATCTCCSRDGGSGQNQKQGHGPLFLPMSYPRLSLKFHPLQTLAVCAHQ